MGPDWDRSQPTSVSARPAKKITGHRAPLAIMFDIIFLSGPFRLVILEVQRSTKNREWKQLTKCGTGYSIPLTGDI